MHTSYALRADRGPISNAEAMCRFAGHIAKEQFKCIAAPLRECYNFGKGRPYDATSTHLPTEMWSLVEVPSRTAGLTLLRSSCFPYWFCVWFALERRWHCTRSANSIAGEKVFDIPCAWLVLATLWRGDMLAVDVQRSIGATTSFELNVQTSCICVSVRLSSNNN